MLSCGLSCRLEVAAGPEAPRNARPTVPVAALPIMSSFGVSIGARDFKIIGSSRIFVG